MVPVDETVLKALAPRESGQRAARQAAIISGMGTVLAATLARYAIDTPLRVAHFLAQTAHESDGFCATEEYADGRADEGRLDLGNSEPGDGPRYKGRGLIQLTGRLNYALTGKELGLDLVSNPLSVNDPITYLLVSCCFWTRVRLNAAADADDLYTVTRLVNGGLNGLKSRLAYLSRAKELVALLAARSMAVSAGPDLPVLCRGATGVEVAELSRSLRPKAIRWRGTAASGRERRRPCVISRPRMVWMPMALRDPHFGRRSPDHASSRNMVIYTQAIRWVSLQRDDRRPEEMTVNYRYGIETLLCTDFDDLL